MKDPNKLNDPTAIAACAQREPTIIEWEHSQDFNHWHYTTNGTNADRNTYINMFTDLTLAYGNLATDNPDSPFAPPGVSTAIAQNPTADLCTNPVHVKNLYNAEYNPEGKYDAITFCDGQNTLFYCSNTMELVDFCSDPQNIITPLPVAMEQAFANTYRARQRRCARRPARDATPLFMLNNAGAVDPCREHTRPFVLALAVDINGNGRRDFGEPIIKNAHERFDDVGSDGCADAYEDGKGGCGTTASSSAVDPNGDNYDADKNPNGTENNWLRDDGEPYRDDGLDGVPNTHDTGEGDGQFTMSAGMQKFLGYDGRTALRKMAPTVRARFNILADGGIRDVFNFGVMSKQLFSLVKSIRDFAVGEYLDFTDIPDMTDSRTGTFNPWNHAWSQVPRDLLLNYGKDNPTDQDRVDGDGDHVGTPAQAVNRFDVMFNWAAATYPNLARLDAARRRQCVWERAHRIIRLDGARREVGIRRRAAARLRRPRECRCRLPGALHAARLWNGPRGLHQHCAHHRHLYDRHQRAVSAVHHRVPRQQ